MNNFVNKTVNAKLFNYLENTKCIYECVYKMHPKIYNMFYVCFYQRFELQFRSRMSHLTRVMIDSSIKVKGLRQVVQYDFRSA